MSSRISTNQIYSQAQSNVANARDKEVTSSEKSATMKEIVRPSQNPSGWVTSANIKDDLASAETMAKNASFAHHSLIATENIFSQLQDYVQRAHELAVGASSEASAPSQTRTFALEEVRGLYDNTLRALNTRYGGRTLLGGYKTTSQAFSPNGSFTGDQGKVEIEIGKGLLLPINIDATQVVQGKGLRNGVDIPETLNRLMRGLENDDSPTIRSTLTDLLQAVDQLSLGRTQVGARMSEIDHAQSAESAKKIESLGQVSQIEEADAAKAFSDLQRDQTILKAAISTSQKILTEDPTQIFFR